MDQFAFRWHLRKQGEMKLPILAMFFLGEHNFSILSQQRSKRTWGMIKHVRDIVQQSGTVINNPFVPPLLDHPRSSFGTLLREDGTDGWIEVQQISDDGDDQFSPPSFF